MSHHLHSLAAHTGSRIDSAAKHNMACKVDSSLYQTWIGAQGMDTERELHQNRMRFAMHKDELVLNVSRKMFSSGKDVNAYPLVVSNCSGMSSRVRNRLLLLYSKNTPDAFLTFLTWLQEQEAGAVNQRDITAELTALGIQDQPADLTPAELNQIRHLPHFHAQGYALGTAYASFMSGDTVATVMIGGMMTVMNGAFACHAGDMMQWYFEDEEKFFSKQNTQNMGEGQRLTLANGVRDDAAVQANGAHPLAGNKRYHDNRAYGMQNIDDKHKSKSVFRIKPYRMIKGNQTYTDHYGDKIRVFAKCIGGGRPFEMVDVMLMTQSL